MNTLIQELAEQADKFADNKLQMPGEYHPDWHEVRDAKLAELIVLECATLCIIEGRAHEQWFGSHCAITVKEHFGVEP